MTSASIDFSTGAPADMDLAVRWIHGTARGRPRTDPAFQLHACDPHTVILRQSKDDTFEAPFLYLLFGNDRALLLDTGAGKQGEERPLRDAVDGAVERWLAANPRTAYELVVLHSHGHGDHVAGDAQFADRPSTTVVGRELDDMRGFLGFTDWPRQTVTLDLGGRILQVLGTPGHHRASVTVFDPWSGFLLTGDSVYPGRLYVPDVPTFLQSLDDLVTFASEHPVRHVMGCHVEMTTTPGRDYPIGARYQPNEAPLPMTVAQLHAVRDAARRVGDSNGAQVFDDFILMNGPTRTYAPAMLARGVWGRVRSLVASQG